MKKLIQLIAPFFPVPLHRWLLVTCCSYRIARSAKLGFCWIFSEQLILEEHSSIGHGTIVKGIRLLSLKKHSRIGRLNWITGYPLSSSSKHFNHLPDRSPQLILGEHAAITNRHIIDCTDLIEIGDFSTLAGFRSQLLTHSIDLENNRQSAQPIKIGSYCFLGTGCILLGGSFLPNYSVLGAGSLLRSKETDKYTLYSGNPAKKVSSLPTDYQYFSRSTGFVK